MALLPPLLVDYVHTTIRSMQEEVLDRFSLTLTHDEALSVITTQKERDAMALVLGLVGDACIRSAPGHYVDTRAVLSKTDETDEWVMMQFQFHARSWADWADMLVPKDEYAAGVFNSEHAAPEIKARILESVGAMRDAALPWAQMIVAFDAINFIATEYSELTFYLPWLPKIICRQIEDISASTLTLTSFRTSFAAQAYKPQMQRFLRACVKNQTPSNGIPMSPEQRAFCRAGDAALAMHSLMAEQFKPTPTEPTWAWIKLTPGKQRLVATPFAGWCATSASLV